MSSIKLNKVLCIHTYSRTIIYTQLFLFSVSIIINMMLFILHIVTEYPTYVLLAEVVHLYRLAFHI